MMGKGVKGREQFLRKHKNDIMRIVNTATLVQFEKNETNKIFAELVSTNQGPEVIKQAINDGLIQPFEVQNLEAGNNIYKKKTNDIYITFDKNLAGQNESFIFTDFNNFPQDFIKIVFEQLNSNNLKGLLYHEYAFKSLGFENIVELANFLGVDIFVLQDKKFKLLHSSSSLNNILKNFLDVVILILFSPIFLFLIIIFSVLVFLFDGTPIFYTQDRVGIKGRQFKIFKFRTMKKIKLTPEQIEELNEKSKVVFKSKKDPRITKFGSFLRKSSIDELPQIINILKNEMSFIGPRPPIPEEVLKYEIKHLKRVSVKPGITGLWQVTLRQDNDFDKWVEKDIEYIDNWSIFLDIKIALKTFKEIINLSGD